jgi:hypothetical protein
MERTSARKYLAGFHTFGVDLPKGWRFQYSGIPVTGLERSGLRGRRFAVGGELFSTNWELASILKNLDGKQNQGSGR